MNLSEATTAAQLSIRFIVQMCSLKTVVCVTMAVWLCYLQLKMVEKVIRRHYMSKYGTKFHFVNYLWCLADLLTAYLHTDKYLMMI